MKFEPGDRVQVSNQYRSDYGQSATVLVQMGAMVLIEFDNLSRRLAGSNEYVKEKRWHQDLHLTKIANNDDPSTNK